MTNLKIATPEAAIARLQQDLQKYTEIQENLFGSYDYQVSLIKAHLFICTTSVSRSYTKLNESVAFMYH